MRPRLAFSLKKTRTPQGDRTIKTRYRLTDAAKSEAVSMADKVANIILTEARHPSEAMDVVYQHKGEIALEGAKAVLSLGENLLSIFTMEINL